MLIEHIIRIRAIEELTHDVKRIQCEKPADYHFIPGQATEVSINKEGWQSEKRPFTFTSLNGSAGLLFFYKYYMCDPLSEVLKEKRRGVSRIRLRNYL